MIYLISAAQTFKCKKKKKKKICFIWLFFFYYGRLWFESIGWTGRGRWESDWFLLVVNTPKPE